MKSQKTDNFAAQAANRQKQATPNPPKLPQGGGLSDAGKVFQESASTMQVRIPQRENLQVPEFGHYAQNQKAYETLSKPVIEANEKAAKATAAIQEQASIKPNALRGYNGIKVYRSGPRKGQQKPMGKDEAMAVAESAGPKAPKLTAKDIRRFGYHFNAPYGEQPSEIPLDPNASAEDKAKAVEESYKAGYALDPSKDDALMKISDIWAKGGYKGETFPPDALKAMMGGKRPDMVEAIFGKDYADRINKLEPRLQNAFFNYLQGKPIGKLSKIQLGELLRPGSVDIAKADLSARGEFDPNPDPTGASMPIFDTRHIDPGQNPLPPSDDLPEEYEETVGDKKTPYNPTFDNGTFYERDPKGGSFFEKLQSALSNPMATQLLGKDPLIRTIINSLGGVASVKRGLESNYSNEMKKEIDAAYADFDKAAFEPRKKLSECNANLQHYKKLNERDEDELAKLSNDPSAQYQTPEQAQERQRKIDFYEADVRKNNAFIYENSVDQKRKFGERSSIYPRHIIARDKDGNPLMNPDGSWQFTDRLTEATVAAQAYRSAEDNMQKYIAENAKPWFDRAQKLKGQSKERKDKKYYNRYTTDWGRNPRVDYQGGK